ncbi:unnamed protein product [marine sediment metagenome]|uniref:Uncharacterized protein n=1 Tax=marine sediment metagenome TaxID=412755 RepID=X1C7J8_9ZZZZ
MATARGTIEWDQTAELWFILANANRPETVLKPYGRHMIHPYKDEADYREPQPETTDWAAVRGGFL